VLEQAAAIALVFKPEMAEVFLKELGVEEHPRPMTKAAAQSLTGGGEPDGTTQLRKPL
jgi:hypothetical protein